MQDGAGAPVSPPFSQGHGRPMPEACRLGEAKLRLDDMTANLTREQERRVTPEACFQHDAMLRIGQASHAGGMAPP